MNAASPSRNNPNTISPGRHAALRALIALDRRGLAQDVQAGDGEETGRDRALAERLTRGVLRRRLLLDRLLIDFGGVDLKRTAPPVLWVLRLAVYEKVFQDGTPDYAIGAQSVALARKVGGEPAGRYANAIVRRMFGALPPDEAALEGWLAAAPGLTDTQRWSIPQEILDAFKRGYGAQEGRAVAGALAQAEAPLWLRANALKSDAAALIETLAAAECVCVAAEEMPEALRWVSGVLPWQTAAWARGEATVQDLGAMLAVSLLEVQPGMAVLDLCAAPGGKTGQLWEALGGTGRLTALEINPHRRATLRQNLERMYGLAHAIEIPDLDDPAKLPADESFDRILIDAPCLALGLIGRHPEVRWDGRLRGIAAMQAQQRAILAAGAARARPGARLLWVTCSPTSEENEAVVAEWLQANPDWRAVERAAPCGWVQTAGATLRTRPDRMACDGFAMTLLERSAASKY